MGTSGGCTGFREPRKNLLLVIPAQAGTQWHHFSFFAIELTLQPVTRPPGSGLRRNDDHWN
jgi:hypothetical protein